MKGRPLSEATEIDRIRLQVRRYFKGRGYRFLEHTPLGRFTRKGWPDFLVLDEAPRHPLWLYIKKPFMRVKPLQKRRIAELRKRGYQVYTVRSAQQAKTVEKLWRGENDSYGEERITKAEFDDVMIYVEAHFENLIRYFYSNHTERCIKEKIAYMDRIDLWHTLDPCEREKIILFMKAGKIR